MKKNYITVVLLLASGVLLFTGCRKDLAVNPADVTIRIPKEVKDYLFFKTGTYWVYKDSVSGAIDCVYVTEHSQGFDTVYEDGKLKAIYERFLWTCEGTFEGVLQNYWVTQSWYEPNSGTKVFYSKFDNVISTTMVIFNYPYKLNVFYGSGFISDDTTYYQNYYESFIMDGVDYSGVVQSIFKKYDYELNKDTKFYLAKHTGIIRREIPDRNRYWKIKRLNLIQ